jgi:glycosyltransferase involved in cell wall biosynthesis
MGGLTPLGMGEASGSVAPLLKEDGKAFKIAVLIPTINNADELDIVLGRLAKQTYSDFEVIISDSKSKDHTKDVCEKYGATWIEDPSRNRADACNYALRQMDHELVLFTDDDTVPPLDWVEKLVRWFDNPEVGAVGGPNFAPDDDPFGAKCADVAFCTKFMTAGTRYGAQPKGELVPITHNPGVNCAHRMANLREVDFFEPGCIGAEDVVLDAKIQRAGHKLFIDPSNVMPHRRRRPFKPYMKQMRNYGYTRMVANKRWPEISAWSHTAIGFFPVIVVTALLAMLYGGLTGGADADLWFSLSGEWDFSRVAFHIPLGLVCTYIGISWLGAAIGTSPHRSIGTVFLAPLFVFLAQWAYGQGVIKAWREIRRTGGRAGEGAQIDDRIRTA